MANASLGPAMRRRERRLRQWHRHERLTVQMAFAAAAHHSAQPDEAPRRQRTARGKRGGGAGQARSVMTTEGSSTGEAGRES